MRGWGDSPQTVLGATSRDFLIFLILGSFNRLISLSQNIFQPVKSYLYKYDYRARRVVRDESQASGNTTKLSYSGGTSVQERENNELTVETIRGSDWGGGVGGILYTIRNNTASFNAYNSRGDVVAKSSTTGTITWSASYEAYGTRVAEAGQTSDRQKANTKEEDPTGLLNEGHRYRDLSTGLFISRDPARFINGPNVYTYVKQNPWTSFDPEGLSAWDSIKSAALKAASYAADVGTGFCNAAVDAAKGVGQLAYNTPGNLKTVAVGAYELATDSNMRAGLGPALKDYGSNIAGAAQEYGSQLASGDAKTVGNALFQVATLVVPAGMAAKGAAVSELGSIANAGGKAVELSSAAAKASEAVSASAKVTKLEAASEVAGAANSTVRQFGGLEFRAVRDLGHVPDGTLQAMQKHGFAGKTVNGDKIVLHHHQQNPAGPIIEMPAPNHSIGNAKQHPFGNQKGMGLTPEQRATFDKTRVDYWKQRATDELNRR